jgi:RNA polymerase sigma factor (sigma-70 family)
LEFAVGSEVEFAELLSRAKALDPDAVERLWKECGPSVLRAIQRRVGRQTSRFDAGDVAQAVWLTFYRNIGKLPEVSSQNDLVKYLEATAANKVRMEYRKHVTSRRRSVDREVAMDAESTPLIAERSATASQFAMGREVWERLVNEAPSEHRRVALMAIDGRSQAEIARELGVHVRTVQRIFDRLKKYLGV